VRENIAGSREDWFILWRRHDESDTPRNTRNCDRDHNTRTNDSLEIMRFNPQASPIL